MKPFESAARLAWLRTDAITRRAMHERVTALLDATARSSVTGSAVERLASVIADCSAAELWLTYAIVHAELPPSSVVRRMRRLRELDGAWAAVAYLFTLHPKRRRGLPASEVIVMGPGTTLLDVTGLLPGDAVREGRSTAMRLAREWNGSPQIVPVTWAANRRSLRALTVDEADSLGLDHPSVRADAVIVPHRARYVLLGVVEIPRSSECLIALGAVSDNETASVGFGLSHIIGTPAYVRQIGEPRFTWHVAAQRSLQHLAVVGDSVIQQYRGWERMLPAIGLTGPALHAVEFRDAVGDATDADWEQLARSVGSAIGIR